MAVDVDGDRAAALERAMSGDLTAAIEILRGVADASADPEDRLFLGKLAFVATDYDEAQTQLERAYRDFQERQLPRRAALAASGLATLFFDGLDEQVIAQGWHARALRLLEREDACVEKGYVLLALTGASVASAEELESNARLALDLAHRFGDRVLECKALADGGLALVSMGRTDEGLSRLDEAFTMIIGGDCPDPGVTSQVVCAMLSA
ncbi:MAG TPA: hypothetical protein VJ818_00475, partial [Actinomycetota bacterium]|nr:hypothetical protein [Actinomycetota bacterium]